MQIQTPSLRIAQFRFFLSGRFFFILGLRMMSTVVGWWIYQITNDPLAIGIVGLSEFLPALLFALYAGHVIDNSEKKFMLLRGVALYGTCVLGLLTLSILHARQLMGTQAIALSIYAIIFCTGIIRSFTGPVFNVMLANIVPRDLLQNATTMNQGTWLSASVCGHALGGLLIAFIGISGTLACIAGLILLGFSLLLRMSKQPPLQQPAKQKTLDSVLEGLRFVFNTKELLGAITLDLFAVLFGGAVAMVPVYARDILRVGPMGFGWLNAATDIGAILSVLILTLFPLRRKQGRSLFFAVAGFGVCIIIFGLSRVYFISFFALMLSGMLDAISVVIRGTIMQLKTPDQMRGRVMSVNSMFINSSNELGQFESGVAARVLGVTPSVLFGGGMTVLIVVLTWFSAPSLRRLQYKVG